MMFTRGIGSRLALLAGLIGIMAWGAPPGAVAQDSSTTEAPGEDAAESPGAQETGATGSDTSSAEEASESPDEDVLLSEDELDDLVAPVALYPDALLAQVLVAATYPLDIVKAQRWVDENEDMAEDARAEAAEAEDWDPSVAVLAAGFPTVIETMASDLDQTEQLGDAMLTQSDDVLAAVQRMRAQADAMGNLPSNEAQTVTVEGDNITIAPTNPEVVYVPTYDSQAVYTTQATEAPVVVDSSSDGFSTGAMVTTGLLSFGAGMLVNEIFDDNDDWYGYWGPAYRPVGWGGGYVRPYPWRGDRIGNDVNVNFDRDFIDIDRNGTWRPDRERRDRARDKLADRRGLGNNRGTLSNRDRDRADLKRKLDAKGGGKAGLDKLKATGGGKNLGQRKGDGKLAQRKPGGKSSALSKKGNLTSAKKSIDRGSASRSKAGLGKAKTGSRASGAKPKLGGTKKISRPSSGGKKPIRKAGNSGSAFGKSRGGGGRKAQRSSNRGKKSRGGGGRRR